MNQDFFVNLNPGVWVQISSTCLCILLVNLVDMLQFYSTLPKLYIYKRLKLSALIHDGVLIPASGNDQLRNFKQKIFLMGLYFTLKFYYVLLVITSFTALNNFDAKCMPTFHDTYWSSSFRYIHKQTHWRQIVIHIYFV